MIDFNDTLELVERNLDTELEEIRVALIANPESVLFALFPAGKKRKGKFYTGDILGSPGNSLEIVLDGEKAGLWADRADDFGGDIFILIGSHFGADTHHDFPRVLTHCADALGRAPSVTIRKGKRQAPTDDLGPATAKWDYHDADGKLIAVVYRYDPPVGKKEFRPWDAKRRKMVSPEPHPFYNQPAIRDTSTVVLVEGEKCAQALIDAGLCATTAMHGANALVDKTDWSPLAGKAVLIWPDRDKPGWTYAMTVADALLATGAIPCVGAVAAG